MYRIGIVLVIVAALLVQPVLAAEYVRGYLKNDGTYVEPHFRSSPNNYRYDNYSARGNVNPFTGERGSQRNEFTDPPAYNQYRNQYRQNFPQSSYGNSLDSYSSYR